MTTTLCACGCETKLYPTKQLRSPSYIKRYGIKRYAHGHNAVGRILSPELREKIAAPQRGVPRKSGPDHPQWTGFTILSNGYRTKWISKHTYRLEHRWIIEQKIGRILTRNEVVHHKNGNKLDNRLKNLEIMSRKAHSTMHQQQKKRNTHGHFLGTAATTLLNGHKEGA